MDCVDLIVVVLVVVILVVVVQCRGQDPLGGTRLGNVRRKTYIYRPVT